MGLMSWGFESLGLRVLFLGLGVRGFGFRRVGRGLQSRSFELRDLAVYPLGVG